MNRKKGETKFIIRTLMLTAALMGLFGLSAAAAMEDRSSRIDQEQSAEIGKGEQSRITGIRVTDLIGELIPADKPVFESETESESESETESVEEHESESESGERMTEPPESETESETEARAAEVTEAETAPETESWVTEMPVTEPLPETLPETETKSEKESAAETETESETQAESAAETETETESESEGIPEVAFTIPEELEQTLARLTGIETEEETESETETETEEEIDERVLIAEAMLEEVQLGSDFKIPMQMPEELGGMPEYAFYHCGKLPYERKDTGSFSENRTFEDLEKAVENAIRGYEGTWSVYVKNLNTDESFLINDTPMKSASVMKLFIMGTVYTAMTDGELERTDTIVSLLNQMITFSSNEASNELLSILGNGSYAEGIAKVNTFIQGHGYSDMTVEYNGFSNPATNTGNGTNQVSAADVGQLLEDIYRRTWLTRAQSNEVESMMLAQDTRYKIPAGLPDGVLCANKTGEMDGTENDAAIIYSDACDYILVILSSDWGSSDLAVSRIGSLSALVYEFFNP